VAPQTVRKPAKPVVRTAKIRKSKHGRVVEVLVTSEDNGKARIRIRMFTGGGRKVGEATKTVATNRVVRVPGLHVAKQAKKVTAALAA
jgi:hypothetical protein